MKVAITGSSGLIGSALVPALSAAGHEVVTLVRRPASGANDISWDPVAGRLDADALEGCEAVVHLAGATIGTRWTKTQRQAILDSRVEGTRLVSETIASLTTKPRVLVAASAIGVYGDRGDEELSEASPPGDGYLAEVVSAWEAAAAPALDAGIRVAQLRTGIVLAKHGGALQRLLLPTRLGLGGPVGSGRQWWSWVTLDDAVAAYRFALEQELAGRFNVTAPTPVTNRDFMKALGRALHRPAVLPLPAFAVRLAFGEMGEEVLLSGQRVRPDALEAAGFRFAQPEIDGALAHVLAA
jgi:uncharacterized protein (TIGR01777 family)